MDDWFIPVFLLAASLWMIWLIQELQAVTHQPPAPKFALWLATIVTGVATVAFFPFKATFRRLNRGERGELETADALDELKSDGYRIIHSIVRPHCDIDHVLVGPAGVFAVETKFRSGRGQIEFRNGEGLFVAGRAEEKDCLSQAIGNAAEVRKLIREHCGIDPWVKALIVFVGDWRVKNNWRDTDTLVLTPDKIVASIRELQPELKRSEIQLIASHLERSARS